MEKIQRNFSCSVDLDLMTSSSRCRLLSRGSMSDLGSSLWSPWEVTGVKGCGKHAAAVIRLQWTVTLSQTKGVRSLPLWRRRSRSHPGKHNKTTDSVVSWSHSPYQQTQNEGYPRQDLYDSIEIRFHPLWNRLPLQSFNSLWQSILIFLSPQSLPFFLVAKRAGSASERLMPRAALYK